MEGHSDIAVLHIHTNGEVHTSKQIRFNSTELEYSEACLTRDPAIAEKPRDALCQLKC